MGQSNVNETNQLTDKWGTGLGADTSINDAELLSNIMLATESILKLRLINNIIISYDLNTRATPATMANQLTLVELFAELKG
jgi:hypothetical protein